MADDDPTPGDALERLNEQLPLVDGRQPALRMVDAEAERRQRLGDADDRSRVRLVATLDAWRRERDEASREPGVDTAGEQAAAVVLFRLSELLHATLRDDDPRLRVLVEHDQAHSHERGFPGHPSRYQPSVKISDLLAWGPIGGRLAVEVLDEWVELAWRTLGEDGPVPDTAARVSERLRRSRRARERADDRAREDRRLGRDRDPRKR